MLGHQAEPFDLQFTTPDGTSRSTTPSSIMVSNNPYVLGPSPDVAQRRTMDSGTLGVFAVNATSGHEAAAMVTRTALGLGERDPRLHEFTAETFEVRSRSGKAFAGIDGEALELDTPLEFRIAPARPAHARARGRPRGGRAAPRARLRPRRPVRRRLGTAVGGARRRRDGGGRPRPRPLQPVSGRHARAIAVAAVGFDLGGTLYHYRAAPCAGSSTRGSPRQGRDRLRHRPLKGRRARPPTRG